jgi:hypothetical protein
MLIPCVGGDEAAQGFLEAMNAGITATTFMRGARIHSTVSEFVPTGELQPRAPAKGLIYMPMPPRRHAHFLFAAIQSALTSSIAAAIASFNLIWVGGFFGQWLRSWAVAWIVMLPVVIVAAPAILCLSEFITRPDAAKVGD